MRCPRVIELVEDELELLDGGLAFCACGEPVLLWSDAVETQEGLEEGLADAGVLLAQLVCGLGGLVEKTEKGGLGGDEIATGGGELGMDGGDEGLLGAGGACRGIGGGDDGDGGVGTERVCRDCARQGMRTMT